MQLAKMLSTQLKNILPIKIPNILFNKEKFKSAIILYVNQFLNNAKISYLQNSITKNK